MNIRKHLPNVSENDELKINNFLAKYPKLDECELLEMVKKELPSTNIVRTFCSIINDHWKELQKTNLLCWDITVHLTNNGFYGSDVDKYLIGLILNHLYCEYISASQVKELVDRIDNYLKGNDRTYSRFIQNLMLFIDKKKLNVPIQVLQLQASTETEEFKKMLERLERFKKYDANAMEDL